MAYGPTLPLGGIRIFYSVSILWDSDLFSTRVKWILLNLTLGSRGHFHPESHLLQMIACSTRRFIRYSAMFSRYFVPSLLQFPSIDKPLWITTYTCRSYNHTPLILLLQDTLQFPLMFWDYFVHVFHKGLRNTIRSSKNPQQLNALEILASLHYV